MKGKIKKGLEQLLLSSALTLSTACASHLPLDSNYQGPKPKTPEVENTFSYQSSYYNDFSIEIERNNRYSLKKVFLAYRDETPLAIGWLSFDYYDVNGKEKVPTILIVPTLNGTLNIADKVARRTATHGYSAIVVRGGEFSESSADLRMIDKKFSQSISNHRRAIDWVETQSDLDSQRIGLLGISAGGIKGTLISAADDRISASVLALTGENLPRILTRSTEPFLSKARDKILQQENCSPEELEQQLEDLVQLDPGYYAQYLDANSVLLILAEKDKVVPYDCGLMLRESIGKPETVILKNSTHYINPLTFVFSAEPNIYRFFKRRFDSISHNPNNSRESEEIKLAQDNKE